MPLSNAGSIAFNNKCAVCQEPMIFWYLEEVPAWGMDLSPTLKATCINSRCESRGHIIEPSLSVHYLMERLKLTVEHERQDALQHTPLRGNAYCKDTPIEDRRDKNRGRRSNDTEGGAVFHPTHYNMGRFEVVDVIDDWKLDFCLGNAIKYIARAPHKGNEIQDLKKAAEYIQLRIERIKEKS